MKTGEGKTLVATLPVYLNALEGKGVHVVHRERLSRQARLRMDGADLQFPRPVGRRDRAWLTDEERRIITRRRHLRHEQRVRLRLSARQYEIQPRSDDAARHHFAIVDEVDSILIDEARTPLIISGPTEDQSEFYRKVDALIPSSDAKQGFRTRREAALGLTLTEAGNEHMVELLRSVGALEEGDLYDINNIMSCHHRESGAARAQAVPVDKDYIVKDNKVVIIDDSPGA
jgi:preprotein translocase subunit SecA